MRVPGFRAGASAYQTRGLYRSVNLSTTCSCKVIPVLDYECRAACDECMWWGWTEDAGDCLTCAWCTSTEVLDTTLNTIWDSVQDAWNAAWITAQELACEQDYGLCVRGCGEIQSESCVRQCSDLNEECYLHIEY
jgi:hypothetical protein